MSVLFSTKFNISKEILSELGVFDPIINGDSHFFINVKRLQATTVPEFLDAYDKINNYFDNIGILLKVASSQNSRTYKEAYKKFDFPEVNGINLGFSKSNRGAGFGTQLRKKIINDAYEIIQTGSIQPEIFHLIGLFEENVGPDRLSDMFARIIFDNILSYNKRIYKVLNISPEAYPDYSFEDGILINPYKDNRLLLLPVEILHKLPVAQSWDDIDRVCSENQLIREEINAIVGERWSKMSSSARKDCMRKFIFNNPQKTAKIIDAYRNTSVAEFNPMTDVDYAIEHVLDSYDLPQITSDTSLSFALEIINNYKEWVEYLRGWSIIQDIPPKFREKAVQCTLHGVAFTSCKTFNWDISPETDKGRGPSDFKISRGNDKTVIEIKLTSNQNCVHGLEVQIEEYAKAEGTNNKIFVLVNVGEGEHRISDVNRKYDEMVKSGKNPAKIIVIDAKPKKSASKHEI